MKNKNLPPVGTKVYHIQYGWGETIRVEPLANDYSIIVKFENSENLFTGEGRNFKGDKHPTLSLTEYDLVKGGFTPISDWNKPKVGDVGYFWDDEDTFPESSADVRYGVLTDVLKDAKECYENNAFTFWGNFSPTIPEWYEKQLEQIKKGLQK